MVGTQPSRYAKDAARTFVRWVKKSAQTLAERTKTIRDPCGGGTAPTALLMHLIGTTFTVEETRSSQKSFENSLTLLGHAQKCDQDVLLAMYAVERPGMRRIVRRLVIGAAPLPRRITTKSGTTKWRQVDGKKRTVELELRRQLTSRLFGWTSTLTQRLPACQEDSLLLTH